MKRRLVWIHLPMTVLMMVVFLMNHMGVDGLPASELWRPELMDELVLDEWPVGEEDTNSNDDDDLDPMDLDEKIYEMEALLAERQEVAVDSINVKDRVNSNNNEEEEEEEEDDVDQDDYEGEEEDDDDNYVVAESDQNNSAGLLERLKSQQPFDSSISDDKATTSTRQHDDESILIPEVAAAVLPPSKATSKLQQQEELDLEVLDQSIVDTLRMALDTVKQDRAHRFRPLDENTPATTDAPVENKTSSSFPISLLFPFGFHVSVSWASYWILGLLLSLIILTYRKFRQQPIRDYHHLPSYSVYKQKSSVD